MSYSPVMPDDDSIRALLRRLDSEPAFDAALRSDPLQVLREARRKVAAQARRGEKPAQPDAIIAVESFDPDHWDIEELEAIVLPPADDAEQEELKRGAASGPVAAIDAVDAEAVDVKTVEGEAVDITARVERRGRLITLGLGVAVCSALAVSFGPMLAGDRGPAGVAPTSLHLKNAGTHQAESAAPAVQGVARFTTAAVGFAASQPAKAQDQVVADAGAEPPAAMSPQQDAPAAPRLTASAGERIALPDELRPGQEGTGDVGAIVLRGLPAGFTVEGAIHSGEGNWVLATDSFAAARIVVPAEASGEVRLTADLYDMSAQIAGAPEFVLDIKPAEAAAADEANPLPTRVMLERGQDLLKAGDVDGARLLFEAAVEGGLAEGALALGESFDPNQLKAAGLTGDAARARYWYEQAFQRGVVAARARLAALQAGT